MKRYKASKQTKTGLVKMRQGTGSREVVGWKVPPQAFWPEIGLDHKLRRGKELKEYQEELKKGTVKR